jgi:RIO kinase 1
MEVRLRHRQSQKLENLRKTVVSKNDKYEAYESRFDPMQNDRQARRKRKPKVKHTPKKSQHEIVAELAETTGLEGGFNPTYQPGPFEEGWLLQSLRDFYNMHHISDVLARVRGGKEANVYRCVGHPSTGMDFLVAKVYRPRMFRNLRNDKMYREGRAILSQDGQALNQSVHGDRLQRALGKKTAYAQQVEHTSWLMHEYTTMQTLYQAGAAVPKPIAASENAILMEYFGNETIAAPTLNAVTLEADEANTLFAEVVRNVELMLSHGLIHGDLSAYNILYWDGQITLIDFPQVVKTQGNSQAQFVLQRDIERICDYFAQQGVDCDGVQIARKLWKRYAEPRSKDKAADLSRLLEAE